MREDETNEGESSPSSLSRFCYLGSILRLCYDFYIVRMHKHTHTDESASVRNYDYDCGGKMTGDTIEL